MEEATALKESGNALFGTKKYADAAETYTKALQTIESQGSTAARELRGSLFYNRSLCYSNLKQADKALSDAENACLCRPRWRNALYRLAEVKQNQSDFEGAIGALKSLLQVVSEPKKLKALRKRLNKLQLMFEQQQEAVKRKATASAAKAEARSNDTTTDTPAAQSDTAASVDSDDDEGTGDEEEFDVLLGFADEEGMTDDWTIFSDGKCGGNAQFLVSFLDILHASFLHYNSLISSPVCC